MEQREKNERKINYCHFFRRMRMSQFAWRHWKYKSDTSSNNTNGKHFIINQQIPTNLQGRVVKFMKVAKNHHRSF